MQRTTSTKYHRPIVSMTMTNDGAREWANITKKNLHKPVAIVLDGYVYSAPEIQNEINGGSSQISGHFTTDDTRDLANVLKSGKMPAPTNIVQEETVGPSLGSASIQAGLYSCIVAFILLMIFMCCYYGLIPGMVANVALVLNFFFTFGVLVSFQAALTMSGIAGLVLSLGMAVDANVLIYERTKEELRSGKNIKSALAAGYGKRLLRYLRLQPYLNHHRYYPLQLRYWSYPRFRFDARYRYLRQLLYGRVDLTYDLRTSDEPRALVRPHFLNPLDAKFPRRRPFPFDEERTQGHDRLRFDRSRLHWFTGYARLVEGYRLYRRS